MKLIIIIIGAGTSSLTLAARPASAGATARGGALRA